MPSSPTLSALRRPWAVWLAVWFTLFAALAPTLSHALARADGASAGTEICTSAGMLWVGGAGPGSRPDHGLAPVHCPFCLLQGSDAAPPPSLFEYLFAAPGVSVTPAQWYRPHHVTLFTQAAAPRGPPAHS